MNAVLRPRFSAIVLSLLLVTACGENNVSFQKLSGDDQAFDITPCASVGGDCNGDTDIPPGDTIETRDEVFFQTRRDSKVDILFVDDNSLSMEEEQKELGNRFSRFVQSLQDLDWQAGITTTDVSSGQWATNGELVKLQGRGNEKILKATTNNVLEVFKKTIVRPETINCNGSCPSGVEQPLWATIQAMDKRNGANVNFFRDGADLAVVVLSDEDEMSTGGGNATTSSMVIDRFKSIWAQEKRLSVFGIIIEPGDQACLDMQLQQSGNTAAYGTHVAQLSSDTGGITGSICDSDYSNTLEAIGDKVRELAFTFELAKVPIAGSVQVTLSPAQNINWRVAGNKIIFAQPPTENTRIDVKYRYVK